jgi:putative sugar O-methyltransferase
MLIRKAKAAVADKMWSIIHRAGLSPRRIYPSKLGKEHWQQLARMRADNRAASAPYNPGPIWEDLARRFERWFTFDGIEAVEDHPLNTFFSSPPPNNPKLLRYASWMLYNDVARRDHSGLLDRISATADPRGPLVFEFEGRLVSWDLLISLDTLYAIADVYPQVLTDAVVVGELGAGWGRIGHVLRLANPKATFVIFDLPEVLLVSQTHLPTRLPGSRILSYDDSRAGPLSRAEIMKYDLVFLGSQDMPRVEDGALDLMINIASFQEMSRDQVSAYLDVIGRKTRDILYTQQLREAGTHGYALGEVSGWDAYPWPPHWTCERKKNAVWSDLYFEAVFRTGVEPKA